MANRPAFFSRNDNLPGVDTEEIPFVWSAGLSIQQKQKNIASFHAAIVSKHPGVKGPLEISSKSCLPLGVALSAFNLGVFSKKSGGFVCVESLYQASKVFASSGPFPVLYVKSAREVRDRLAVYRDQPLVAFEIHGTRWPLVPKQAFYSWLYCQALHHNAALAIEMMQYNCFTDIEFNPARSVNCQAYAAALYVSLAKNGCLERALLNKETFLENYPEDDGCVREEPPKTKSTKRVKQRKTVRLEKAGNPMADAPENSTLPFMSAQPNREQ